MTALVTVDALHAGYRLQQWTLAADLCRCCHGHRLTDLKTTGNNVMRHPPSVYNCTAATHDAFPPNPVAILAQARAWNKERRRRTVVPVHRLPAWWSAVMAETEDARDILLTSPD